MNRTAKLLAFAALACGCALTGWAQTAQPTAAESTAKAPAPEVLLKVSFAGETSQWTLAQLAALPHSTATVFNPKTKQSQDYSGVLLWDLLPQAAMKKIPHKRVNRHYLFVQSADGFASVLSLSETNPKTQNSVVILADALDGKPLADGGPLMLVDSADKAPERWVRQVAFVELREAN